MKTVFRPFLLVVATAAIVDAAPPSSDCPYPTKYKATELATRAGYQQGVRYTFRSGTEATTAATEILRTTGAYPVNRPPGAAHLDYRASDVPRVNSFFGIDPRLAAGLSRVSVLLTFRELAREVLGTCPANPDPARDNYSDPVTGDVKACKKRNPCDDPANPACQATRGGVRTLDGGDGIDADGDGWCDEPPPTPRTCPDGTPAPDNDPSRCGSPSMPVPPSPTGPGPVGPVIGVPDFSHVRGGGCWQRTCWWRGSVFLGCTQWELADAGLCINPN
jgi:hypothetical protein